MNRAENKEGNILGASAVVGGHELVLDFTNAVPQ